MEDFYLQKFKNYQFNDEIEAIKSLINTRIYELQSNICKNGQFIEQQFLDRESKLSLTERILTGLGIISYMLPDVFSKFLNLKSIPIGKKIGGRIENNVFHPTLQTLFFLKDGFGEVSLQKRQETVKLFENRSELNRLIDFIEEDNSNLLDKRFALRKEVISLLVYGKKYSPDYDIDFPAKVIKTKMSWDDLVLPYETIDDIEEIINWAKYGDAVLTQMKLGRKLKQGYRALFYGPSGTGKTLTATLIGSKVNMPVYRIDSAQITSKYVGETEKNLERIFEYAEDKNWILFFDEAESLFSKRTSTKTSNDRYSNQQVAYLLQRIEDFPGIIVLSSNKKGEMDQAFLRRFQMMLEFKIPNMHERLLLWKKGLEEDFKLDDDIDLESIAEAYEITGGILINILRTLGVNAIKNKTNLLQKKNILDAIKKEFNKMGKTYSSI